MALLAGLYYLVKAITFSFTSEDGIYMRTVLVYFSGQFFSIAFLTEVFYFKEKLYNNRLFLKERMELVGDIVVIERRWFVNYIFFLPSYHIRFLDGFSINFFVLPKFYDWAKSDNTPGGIIKEDQ